MAEKKEKTYEICGVELTNKGEGYLTMGKKDYEKVLDSKGVTKEVRDTVAKAQSEIVEESLKVARDVILDQGVEKAEVKLGTGDGSLRVDLVGRQERTITNPQTKEQSQVVNFGVATVKVKHSVPQALQGTLMAEIASDCEKAFSKKK